MNRWLGATLICLISVAIVFGDKESEKPDDQELTSTCIDLSPVCKSWADYCEKLSEGTFQKHWCPKTCGRCGQQGVVLADAAPNLPAGVDGGAKDSSTTSTSTAASTSTSTAASTSTSTSAPSSTSTSTSTSASTSTSTSPSTSTSTTTASSSASSSSSSPSTSTSVGSTSSAAPGGAAADNSSTSTTTASSTSTTTAAPSSSSSSTTYGPPGNVPPPNPNQPINNGGPSSLGGNASDLASQQFINERPYLCQADYRLLPKLNDDIMKLAVGLYRKAIEDSPKENLLFAPAAIAVALAMLEVGARTVAQGELHQVLSPSLNGEEEAMGYAALLASLRGEGGQSHLYNLKLTNALYADNNFPMLRDYAETATKCFDTVTGNFDFQRKYDASRLQINDWVRDHTDYKIQNLFPPNGIDSDDRMVLINVVSLQAEWANSFANGRTYNRLFYPPNNAPGVEVAMMSLEGTFRYYEQSDLQVLGIDYKQHELTLFLILPTNREGLPQIERTLDPKELNRLMNAAQDAKVDVTIPKFVVNYRLRLKEALQAMGIKLVFDISGDMHGISKKHDLFLTNAVHQAVFKVAERGTDDAESAAVVPLSFAGDLLSSKSFIADHPFIFLLRHQPSGNLAFAGRYVDPRRDSKE